eukprot:gb/GFBE01036624.1/.p1 GENE.gb/GFBE01036624.1/~~gb/GFBE01036624.1/.p1  ORF type:complete len:951 (+),score=240.37 gb/GFBE01036624.1/:1-2853(+)
MAYLPQPPFDFAKEELVTGSLDIGTDRLAGGFGWLVTCVQEQNQLLSTLCGRVDGLQAGGAVPSSQSLQTSMKEEMLSMQLNTLRHEVSSLPRSGDLERQRERVLAEVSSMSNSVSDRQRDSDERMQKELANVTDALCKQLERISTDVSTRLTSLEERFNNSAPAGVQGASASQGASTSQGVSGSRGVTPPSSSTQAGAGDSQAEASASMAAPEPPQPTPLSPSNVAEDTEGHTDGALEHPSAAIPPAPGASLADMSALDARLNARMEALERQLAELSTQQTALAAAATAAPAATEAAGAAPAAPPPAAEAAPVDTAAVTSAAVQAANEAVAAARAADQEAISTLRDALAQMTVQIEEMKVHHTTEINALLSQVQASSSASAAAQAEGGVSSPAAPSDAEAPVSPSQAQAAAAASAVSEEATAALKEGLGAAQGRLDALEASLKKVEATLPEFKKAVPDLEASIRKVEEALASVAESQATAGTGAGGGAGAAVFGSSGDVSFGPDTAVRGAQPGVAEVPAGTEAASAEQAAAVAASAPEAVASNDIAMLRARLLAVEEWQEQTEKKLKQWPEDNGAEGFEQAGAGPGLPRSRTQSSSKESRRATSRSSPGETRTSEFHDGYEGPPGGRWKDVQAELEHFRKLFEFIEGVLPEDAAEAMRFFNRRQQGKEELSGKVSEVFGPDVDFIKAKSQLEDAFSKQTLDMHREFENLALALKGLQRDVESSGGKIQDLGKRMSQVEGEAKDFRSFTPATNSMEDQPHQEPSPRHSGVKEMLTKVEEQAAAGGQVTEEMINKSLEELREDVRQWLDMLRASVLQALQTKPDHEQVSQFVKEVVGKPGDELALFAKRSLLGKCASCETPIDVDLMRVKRPQPISLQGPWPVHGDSMGAKMAIRPIGSGSAPRENSASSHSRLPKINDTRAAANFAPKGKSMKPSSSSPDIRREQASSAE